MADYSLECCGGFPEHKHWCYVQEEIAALEKIRRDEEEAWTNFFDKMTDEQLFVYIDDTEKKLANANRYRNRLKRAHEYLRRYGPLQKYTDYRMGRLRK
jgi:hypothetical protein